MRSSGFYIRLFGAFAFGTQEGQVFVLGAKQQALLAMLATAKDGVRTRSWLQGQLWGNVQPAQASGSLRNALSSLRRIVGPSAETLISATRERVTLNLDQVVLVGAPGDGEFLEGLDVKYEDEFNDWLRNQRQSYAAHFQKPAALGEAYALEPRLREVERLDLLPPIAVLPLQSRAAEPDQVALGDAIAEEVSRSLSRSQVFNVISHLSCRGFAARHITLPEVTQTLGANYLVAGHIACDGGDFCATVDLHEARTGRLLWSREFLGSLADFLRGELDIAREIARLASRSVIAEAARLVQSKPLPSLACHEMLIGAIARMYGQKPSDFAHAQALLNAAAERAPDRSILHAWLGKWHVLRVQKGLSDNIESDRRAALDCTARALDLDPECPLALSIDGFVHSHLCRRMDVAETRYRGAIDSDPNNAFSWLLLGVVNAFSDRPDAAVRYTTRARRLSPLDPQQYYFESLSATAHLSAGEYPQALELAERSMARNRRHPSTLRVRTIALQRLGRTAEARRAATELMRLEPDLTERSYLARHPAAEFGTGRDWARALREAGIPA